MAYEMSGSRFSSWVAGARVGSALEYHRGELSRDCADDLRGVDVTGAQLLLRHLRHVVATAHEMGFVTLMQKRHAENDTSYIAIRREKHVDE